MRIQNTPFGSNPFKRSVAVLTAGLFVFTGLFNPTPAASAQSVNPIQVHGGNSSQGLSRLIRDEKIQIPPELGIIDESFHGESGRSVVYLQDAHDSLEAQENIAKTIHYLVSNYGVKTVFEEGYEGPVPTDKYFGFMKDPTIKEKVSYFLMDHLRIGGAEYAHINRTQGFALMGADSLKLHKENVGQYRLSASKREGIAKDLKALSKELKTLTDARFPKEFKEWLKTKEQFDGKKLDLFTYLGRTLPLLEGHGSEKGSGLMGLIFDAIRSGDAGFAEKVKHIDAREVFGELLKLEEGMAGTYLKGAGGRELFEYTKELSLLDRLNALQVSQEEYEAVRAGLEAFDTDSFARFIFRQAPKTLILSRMWERNIKEALRFYEIASARDGAVSTAFEKYFSGGTSQSPVAGKEGGPAVLVYGGFHKEKIKRILEEEGISYVVVSPRMTHPSLRHEGYYKQLMTEGRLSYELPANLRVATRAESRIEVWEGNTALARTELGIMAGVARDMPGADPRSLGLAVEQALKTFASQGPARSEVRVLSNPSDTPVAAKRAEASEGEPTTAKPIVPFLSGDKNSIAIAEEALVRETDMFRPETRGSETRDEGDQAVRRLLNIPEGAVVSLYKDEKLTPTSEERSTGRRVMKYTVDIRREKRREARVFYVQEFVRGNIHHGNVALQRDAAKVAVAPNVIEIAWGNQRIPALVSGEPFDVPVLSGASFQESDPQQFAAELGNALGTLHGTGIVHDDLIPRVDEESGSGLTREICLKNIMRNGNGRVSFVHFDHAFLSKRDRDRDKDFNYEKDTVKSTFLDFFDTNMTNLRAGLAEAFDQGYASGRNAAASSKSSRTEEKTVNLEVLVSQLLVNGKDPSFFYINGQDPLLRRAAFESQMALFRRFQAASDPAAKGRLVQSALEIARRLDPPPGGPFTQAVQKIARAYWEEWHRKISYEELNMIRKYGAILGQSIYIKFTWTDSGAYPQSEELRRKSLQQQRGLSHQVILVLKMPSFLITKKMGQFYDIGLPNIGDEMLPESFLTDSELLWTRRDDYRFLEGHHNLTRYPLADLDIETSQRLSNLLMGWNSADAITRMTVNENFEILKAVNVGVRPVGKKENLQQPIPTSEFRSETREEALPRKGKVEIQGGGILSIKDLGVWDFARISLNGDTNYYFIGFVEQSQRLLANLHLWRSLHPGNPVDPDYVLLEKAISLLVSRGYEQVMLFYEPFDRGGFLRYHEGMHLAMDLRARRTAGRVEKLRLEALETMIGGLDDNGVETRAVKRAFREMKEALSQYPPARLSGEWFAWIAELAEYPGFRNTLRSWEPRDSREHRFLFGYFGQQNTTTVVMEPVRRFVEAALKVSVISRFFFDYYTELLITVPELNLAVPRVFRQATRGPDSGSSVRSEMREDERPSKQTLPQMIAASADQPGEFQKRLAAALRSVISNPSVRRKVVALITEAKPATWEEFEKLAGGIFESNPEVRTPLERAFGVEKEKVSPYFKGLGPEDFESWLERVASAMSGLEITEHDQAALVLAYHPHFFQRLGDRLDRIFQLIRMNAPGVIVQNEGRMVAESGEAVDYGAPERRRIMRNKLERIASLFNKVSIKINELAQGDKSYQDAADQFAKVMRDDDGHRMRVAAFKHGLIQLVADPQTTANEVAARFAEFYEFDSEKAVETYMGFNGWLADAIAYQVLQGGAVQAGQIYKLIKFDRRLLPAKMLEEVDAEIQSYRDAIYEDPLTIERSIQELTAAVKIKDLDKALASAAGANEFLSRAHLGASQRSLVEGLLRGFETRLEELSQKPSPRIEEIAQARRNLDIAKELTRGLEARADAISPQDLHKAYSEASELSLKAAAVLPGEAVDTMDEVNQQILGIIHDRQLRLESEDSGAPDFNKAGTILALYEKLRDLVNQLDYSNVLILQKCLGALEIIDQHIQEVLFHFKAPRVPLEQPSPAVPAIAPAPENYSIHFTQKSLSQLQARWKISASFREKFHSLVERLSKGEMKGDAKGGDWAGLISDRLEGGSFRVYWRMSGQGATFVGMFHKDETTKSHAPGHAYLAKMAGLKDDEVVPLLASGHEAGTFLGEIGRFVSGKADAGRAEKQRSEAREVTGLKSDLLVRDVRRIGLVTTKSQETGGNPWKVLRLEQDVIAVIEQARIDALSPEMFKELLEIAGLNSGKLHLVIPDALQGKYSERVTELRKVTSVYDGFPRVASFDKIPVIGFSDMEHDTISAFQKRLDPKLVERMKDSAFGFNQAGSFGVGILYALKEIPSEQLPLNQNGFRFDRSGWYAAQILEVIQAYTVISTSA